MSKAAKGSMSSENQRRRRSGGKKQGTAKLFFAEWLWGCLGIRRLDVVGERENGCAWGSTHFFLCPLLPSACYASYLGIRWDTVLSLSGDNILERATFIYNFHVVAEQFTFRMVLAQILVEYPPPPVIPPTGDRSRNLPDLTLYMYHVLRVIRMKFLLIMSML